ncbi:MAG: hypothetical protein WBA46_08640 [Thermomicrobiales bacterium]
MDGIKKKGILAGIAAVVLFVIIIVVLYLLGGDGQSALERLRDISIIFITFLFLITVILLAAVVAALIFLAMQVKDRVIPLLEEATGTVKQVRGTTEFISEEAVKPIISAAGQYSKWRSMGKVVAGKAKRPKV